MDDQRIVRIETRVDEIKDDVAEIKAEQKVTANSLNHLQVSVNEYYELIKQHVSGDDKIITEIGPIIEEFKFQQEIRRRRNQKIKDFSLKLGLLATVVGIFVGIAKIFSL